MFPQPICVAAHCVHAEHGLNTSTYIDDVLDKVYLHYGEITQEKLIHTNGVKCLC